MSLPTALPQLFQAEPTPVPVSSSAGGYQPAGLGSPAPTSPPLGFGSASTLDEPVWDTVKRDLKRIWKNLVMVVFPFKDRSQQSAALRNWDLWGPMVRAGRGGAGRGGQARRRAGRAGAALRAAGPEPQLLCCTRAPNSAPTASTTTRNKGENKNKMRFAGVCAGAGDHAFSGGGGGIRGVLGEQIVS